MHYQALKKSSPGAPQGGILLHEPTGIVIMSSVSFSHCERRAEELNSIPELLVTGNRWDGGYSADPDTITKEVIAKGGSLRIVCTSRHFDIGCPPQTYKATCYLVLSEIREGTKQVVSGHAIQKDGHCVGDENPQNARNKVAKGNEFATIDD